MNLQTSLSLQSAFRRLGVVALGLALGLLIAPAAYADEVQIADGDTAALLAALEAAGQSGEPTTISLATDGQYEWPDTGSRIVLGGTVTLLGNGATVTVPYNYEDHIAGSPWTVAEGATYEIRDLAWNGTYFGGPWLAYAGSLAMINVTFSGRFIPAIQVLYHGSYQVYGSLMGSQEDSAVLALENVTFDIMFALNDSISFPNSSAVLQLDAGTASLQHVTIRGRPSFGDDEGGRSYTMIGVGTSDIGYDTEIAVSNSIVMIHIPNDPDFVNVASLPCVVVPGVLTSLGGNVSNRNSHQVAPGDCGFETTIDYEAAGFGSFGDHGGPVPTLSLRGWSPAVNTGADAYCLPTDARGYLRGAECDAGAFELGAAIAGGSLGDKGAGGYWNAPNEDLFGFLAVSFPDTEMALLVWSTFDASGHSTTVYGTGSFVDEDTIEVPQALIDLPVAGSNPVRSEPEVWGSLRLDLESCTDAHFSYQTSQPGFASGQKDIGRLSVFSSVGCSELAD